MAVVVAPRASGAMGREREKLDFRMDRIRVVKQPPSLSPPLSQLFVLDPISTASDLQAHVVW